MSMNQSGEDRWAPFETGKGVRWKKRCQVCKQYRGMSHLIGGTCGRCKRFGRTQIGMYGDDSAVERFEGGTLNGSS